MERKQDLEETIYSNLSTQILLNYDIDDIINEISLLEYEDYYETILDVVGDNLLLYVFKKVIKDYEIYIKITLKNDKIIICFSFHISKEVKL